MEHEVIGISGRKQSGKDFAYQILNANLMSQDVAVNRYAFADEVKRFAAKYFGYPNNEEQKEQFRFVLQGIGQMFREEVDKNFWVDRVLDQIAKDNVDFTAKGVKHISIITDVRYKNEVEAVKAIGTVVRIERPSLPRTDNHPSEAELDHYPFEHVIFNDGSKSDYIEKVRQWALQWKNQGSR